MIFGIQVFNTLLLMGFASAKIGSRCGSPRNLKNKVRFNEIFMFVTAKANRATFTMPAANHFLITVHLILRKN